MFFGEINSKVRRMTGMAEITLLSALSMFVRWSISLNSYSGAGKAPMFGDYEAQRHWMEITYHLPSSQWYFNTSDNDLMYWGLDYPPLTAYHSRLLGAISNKINTSWVELHQSRGIENEAHKLFMRYSVLIADLLMYFPAVFVYFYIILQKLSHKQKLLGSMLTLLYPGLVLIDHGHFQYNCVSLGFALWAVIGLCSGCDLQGAAAFVLALNYKQMELYHAMPFFCYLLGSCFNGKQNWLWKLVKLGVVVLVTFAVCWWPFLHNVQDTLQVLHRLFPFARGLYEDKVANVWCSISVLVKLKNIFSVPSLVKVCLGSTVVLLIPSSLHLLLKPSTLRFRLALINASMVFFLFSFQVHEKSILLSALPVCLLLPWKPFGGIWFLIVSVFSMLPLIIKDNLVLPYAASMLLFIALSSMLMSSLADTTQDKLNKVSWLPRIMFCLSMTGCLVLTIASLTVLPPKHLPDLLPLGVSVYSCAHFLAFLLYFHWLQFTCEDNIPVVMESTQASVKVVPSFEQQIERKLGSMSSASHKSPKSSLGPKQRTKSKEGKYMKKKK